jgi:hypothetical protein
VRQLLAGLVSLAGQAGVIGAARLTSDHVFSVG